MKALLAISAVALFTSISLRAFGAPASAEPLLMDRLSINGLPVKQRVAVSLEAKDKGLKGCVLYLEGFGDSIRNHQALFQSLSKAGYRVLAFDYLGQGGSDGNTNDMRVDGGSKNKKTEIGSQAAWLWDYYSRTPDPEYGRTCAGSPKLVIGWSTGGLAAYKLAAEHWADAVALIEPSIVPNMCVGEAGGVSLPLCLTRIFTLLQVITERTLTSAKFEPCLDPHLDPVRPTSLVAVHSFGMNMNMTAHFGATKWKIDPSVKGIAFLGGRNNTFSDDPATADVLRRNAPHFGRVEYEEGLHELDNEVPRVAEDMRDRTVRFFDSVAR